MLINQLQPKHWDDRRNLIIPGNNTASVIFCIEHFEAIAKQSIQDHGAFYVALSGGSTPKAIFEHLTVHSLLSEAEWSKIHIFWSDERAVPPTHADSNYKMAMDAGLAKMPIPRDQIHRMQAEDNIEVNAQQYEQQIKKTLKNRPFDLIMLGIGDDGHTASLFPHTEGLKTIGKLIVANYLPEKEVWRMTMTFECINSARNIAVYVLGAQKKFILSDIFFSQEEFDRLPAQRIGSKAHKALWIADEAAAMELIEKLKKKA